MHMVPRCHMAYSSRFVFCIIPMSSSSWPDAGRCRIGGLIQAGAGRGAGRLELGGRAGRLGRPSGEDGWQPPEGAEAQGGEDGWQPPEGAEAQGAASESTLWPATGLRFGDSLHMRVCAWPATGLYFGVFVRHACISVLPCRHGAAVPGGAVERGPGWFARTSYTRVHANHCESGLTCVFVCGLRQAFINELHVCLRAACCQQE
jgi:hypothetical protein